jgi:hypothetical protein
MYWNLSILKVVTVLVLSIQFCSTAKAQVVFVETSEKNAVKVVATSIAWGFLGGALLAGGLSIAFQSESEGITRVCIGGGTIVGFFAGVYELKQENEKPPPAPALEFDQNGFAGFAIPVPRLEIERQTSKYLRSIEKRDLLRLRLNLVGVKF